MSPILLLFGGGMVVGNLLGGSWPTARRCRAACHVGALALVLGVMTFGDRSPVVTVVLFVGLLGVAAFATVAPLQMRVLQKARAPGRTWHRA